MFGHTHMCALLHLLLCLVQGGVTRDCMLKKLYMWPSCKLQPLMRKGLVACSETPREKLFIRKSVCTNQQIKEGGGSRIKICQSDLCSCMPKILESWTLLHRTLLYVFQSRHGNQVQFHVSNMTDKYRLRMTKILGDHLELQKIHLGCHRLYLYLLINMPRSDG